MAEAIQERARMRMTAAEYLQLPESNLPMELIDGEIITLPAPKTKHLSAKADRFEDRKPLKVAVQAEAR